MAGGHIGRALRRLRGLLGAQCAEGPTDGDLLRRYVHARDEAAFEALLRRHGPMVLGVCRRVLAQGQDVDDAFQATFLILIRKAASIGDGERVGNWLYGVAYRVAVRARAQATRLRARQRLLTDLPDDEAPPDPIREELRALLDEEVSRLPARYREAVVCCYLQGRTQEEAARVLGWPKGTVATRLNRARQLLRTRLVRRGLPVSAGTLIGVLRAGSADGAVPPGMLTSAVRTAGQALTRSALPPAVARLAGHVLRQVFLGRVKAVAAAMFAVALVTGGGGLALRSARSSPAPEPGVASADARPAEYYAWREQAAPSRSAAVDAPLAAEMPCCDAESSEPDKGVTAIVLTGKCQLVATVYEDGTVCIGYPATGRPRLCVKGATGQVSAPPIAARTRGTMRITGNAGTYVLREPDKHAGDSPGGLPCKVIITFLDDGRSGPDAADGRLARSVVPPGTRRMLIETRVWLPPAHAYVRASKVVIQTAPAALPAPAPPPPPEAPPEARRRHGGRRCSFAMAVCHDGQSRAI